MQIKIDDAVMHQNYPIGIIKAIRKNIANGEVFGIIQLHGYAEEGFQSIPMVELSIDNSATVAA